MFSDFLGYNPYVHILVMDGYFYGNAKSMISNDTNHFNFKPNCMYLWMNTSHPD